MTEATGVVEASTPHGDTDATSPASVAAVPGSADTEPGNSAGQERPTGTEDSKPKKAKADKEPKKVYEAGGIIVLDGKVVLRFTDGQNWIFPKGKLKKRESPEDAAIREAVEETGLKVEIVGPAGEFTMKSEGKKRRFVFYLMRAVDKTWDWPHHEGRDTFVMDADRVGSLLRKGYRKLWESCEERVRALAEGERVPTPAEATSSSAEG